jgi:glycosyltransferase involved in cell wall biosynthesis
VPKVLYITTSDLSRPRGGRALLSALHHECLRDLLDDDLDAYVLDKERSSLAMALRGFVDGITPQSIDRILTRLRSQNVECAFLDGSNLGQLARTIRRALPKTRIITFFHNVEARFFWGSFRHRSTLHAAGVLAANYLAERLAVLNSDDIITLSARDSDGLRRLYGRGATGLLPMAIADQLTDVEGSKGLLSPDAPLLFVGGAYYGNRDGIAWFAREVAPHISLRTRVVGQGMEAMRHELECYPGVEVIGTVGDLEPFYRDAKVVIAPIFDGSGMKTKVAEALMYGKRVIGTKEAFSGYESIADQSGWCCSTSSEFIAAVEAARQLVMMEKDPNMRTLYERHHSPRAVRARLSDIM